MINPSYRVSNYSCHVIAAAAFAASIMATPGCKVANLALRADFTDFNTILQGNQSQQMLLNLVRMRYRETPLFMQAGSLTASYESSISADSSASIPSGDPTSIDIGGSYKFSSKPTITYTPIEGKEYVQQFMAEITPQTFAMLVRSGWPISKLGHLLIASVTLESGERVIGRLSAESYPKFQEFIKTLKHAEDQDELTIVGRKDGGMDVQIGAVTFAMERIQFRSLFSAMFNASKDVQIPEQHSSWVKAGEGTDEINIRVSDRAPADALVSVEYAGVYYSIANNDLRSKDTLALLIQLSRIQSGPSGQAPVITIPAR